MTQELWNPATTLTWIKENLADYIKLRDGWKEHTPQWETYDLMVREYRKIITKLEESAPPVQAISAEEIWDEILGFVADVIDGKRKDIKTGQGIINSLKEKYSIQRKQATSLTNSVEEDFGASTGNSSSDIGDENINGNI